MLKLGLIGKDIAHSRSKEMYEKLLGESVDYSLLDYATENDIPPLKELFQMGFQGLSITYPYKKTFLKQVQIEDSDVVSIGAINCLRIESQLVYATNTDFLAAKELLKDFDVQKSQFLVLGDGNMANIFCSLLKELKATHNQVYRKKDGDLNNLDYSALFSETQKSPVVINCCSRSFVFSSNLPSGAVFWDMNYSLPAHQKLASETVRYREGVDLLELQAKFALQFWEIPQ